MGLVKDADMIPVRNRAWLNVTATNGQKILKEPINFIGTDYAAKPLRAADLTKIALAETNNKRSRTVDVSWKTELRETMSDTTGTHNVTQNGGTFYDLLPKGHDLKVSSVKLANQEGLLDPGEYDIIQHPDFRGSGRTMVEVRVTTPGDWYKMSYDTTIGYDALADVGHEPHNSVAYETGNADMADGFPDDGGDARSFQDHDYMTDLDPASDALRFLYADGEWEIGAVANSVMGLQKTVKSAHEEAFTYESTAYSNEAYTYNLRMTSDTSSSTKNIVFYDSLENYVTPAGQASDWHGSLVSVNTGLLADRGIAARVYLSDVADLNLLRTEDAAGEDAANDAIRDLSNTDIWLPQDEFLDKHKDDGGMAAAKAFAVDCSKTTDGSDYVLGKGQGLGLTVTMQAPQVPDADADLDPVTYNNIFLSATSVDANGGQQDHYIYQDFTRVHLHVAGSLPINKVDTQGQSVQGASFRLFGTSDYGTAVDLTRTSSALGKLRFDNVERGTYSLVETACPSDYLRDPLSYTVTVDAMGQVTVEAHQPDDEGYYTFVDQPRLHGPLTIRKDSSKQAGTVIKDTTFHVYGTSDYGEDVDLYATTNGSSQASFPDLAKGTYTLEESTANPDYVKTSVKYTVKVEEGADASGRSQVQVSLTQAQAPDADAASDLPQKENVTYTNTDGTTVTKTANGAYTITNKPKYLDLIFTKADADSLLVHNQDGTTDIKFLTDAAFRLSGTADDGTVVDQTATSENLGLVTFIHLGAGTYVLEETQTPAGYDTAQPRSVTVTADGTLTVDPALATDGTGALYFTNVKSRDGRIKVIKAWDTPEGTGPDFNKAMEENNMPVLHLTTEKPGASQGSGITDPGSLPGQEITVAKRDPEKRVPVENAIESV